MRISTVRFMIAGVLSAAVLAGAMAPAVAATSVVRAGQNTSGAYVWKPSSKSIPRGNRIQWRNPTGVTHNIVAYGGNWSFNRTIGPGQRTGRDFNRRGVFRYRCTFHSTKTSTRCRGMCGRINVG